MLSKDLRPPRKRDLPCQTCGRSADRIERTDKQLNGKWVFRCSHCGDDFLSIVEPAGFGGKSVYWQPVPKEASSEYV